MIQILLYLAIGWGVLFTIVLANEHRRIRRAKQQRRHEPERTVLEEVRELRQLGTDLNSRLEALEKSLAATRSTGAKARPEPVAPRSA